MPKPAGHTVSVAKFSAVLSAVSAAVCVALVSACSSPQLPASSPGTTPSVWKGSPGPSTSAHAEGVPSRQEAPPAAQGLSTVLKNSDGTQVATAKFDFSNGYATVTVTTSGTGLLSPGFHGVHIHKVGKCEGDFTSAGGHYQAPGQTGQPGQNGQHSSGDLSSLQIRKDGSGMLVTTTDGFTLDELLAGSKTAIIIHAGSDNFANIPADRYNQTNGTPGADETTMTTGDAGKRVACGVIGAG